MQRCNQKKNKNLTNVVSKMKMMILDWL